MEVVSPFLHKVRRNQSERPDFEVRVSSCPFVSSTCLGTPSEGKTGTRVRRVKDSKWIGLRITRVTLTLEEV